MDHEKNLTIIIPHRNMPVRLAILLDSIGSVHGSSDQENIQVIVVDDHSDRGLDQLERCRRRYRDRVLFLRNDTDSRGAGAARNIGLDHAEGKWLLFADADDYFVQNWRDVVQPYMDTDDKELDLIYFVPTSRNLKTGGISHRHVRCEEQIRDYLNHVSGAEARLRYRFWVPWSKMIRTETVRDHHIRFDEVQYSNDVMFSTKAGYYARRIAADLHTIYCVTEQEGTLSGDKSADCFCMRREVECRWQQFMETHLSEADLLESGRIRFLNAAVDAVRAGHGPGTILRLAQLFAKYGKNSRDAGGSGEWERQHGKHR